MSTRLIHPALVKFVAATAGRNMTKAAYVAVTAGIATMVLLTVDPAYESAHHWVDAVLWTCLAYFVFEWGVRLRHAFLSQAWLAYVCPSAGWWMPSAALAVPLAMLVRRRAQDGLAARRAVGR